MKATSILATAAFLSAVAIPIRADDSAYVEPVAPENASGRTFEISTRVGAFKPVNRGNDFHSKAAPAFRLEIRANLFDSPFDFVFRGYATQYDYEFRDHFDNGDHRIYSSKEQDYVGSAALQLNFNRQGQINPYVAAGFQGAYWKYDDKEESFHSWSTVCYESNEYSDSGNNKRYVVRGGMEFNISPLFLVGEYGWMSKEIGEELSCQLSVAVLRVGWKLTDACRIDAGIDYYWSSDSDWETEQFFASAGLAFFL